MSKLVTFNNTKNMKVTEELRSAAISWAERGVEPGGIVCFWHEGGGGAVDEGANVDEVIGEWWSHSGRGPSTVT